MALIWSTKDVVDWQKKQEEDYPTLECLIWATLAIGMGKLNEKTAEEFLYRLKRCTLEGKPMGMVDGNPIEWTMEMLKTWFGLSTNVSIISNSAFDQKMRQASGRDKIKWQR